MSPKKAITPEEMWFEWFSTSAFTADKRLFRLFRALPSDPRCKFCQAPFEGLGGGLVKALFGKQQSRLNPKFCNLCEEAARKNPGGSEVEMAMLFADIRDSTGLSERMSPIEFSRLINRFYTAASKLIADEDGLVDKLVGDEIVAFWGAGFAGDRYIRRAILVARKLSRLLIEESIPVGIGVHAGVAFFGSMGAADGLTDITALGDEVNTAARIASKAGAGELLVSEQALMRAEIDAGAYEPRLLELKGISRPVAVRVIRDTDQPIAI